MENWPTTPTTPAPAPMEPIAVRPDEAARLLGVSPRTLDKLIKARAIDSRTVGRARLVAVPSIAFDVIDENDLVENYPKLRPVLVEGLIRRTEVANIIASPKIGKTWLAHGIAMAVATGTPWLGRKVEHGRVLIIDAELYRETLAYRMRRTREIMGVRPSRGWLSVWPIRGRCVGIDVIERMIREHSKPGDFSLIILDALYRLLPKGTEENSNDSMTAVYNVLCSLADWSGAGVAVIHHTSKGDQSSKGVTDTGSGAGAVSRAADAHIVLREHIEDDCVSVHARVRDFAQPDPFVIRNLHPGWQLDPNLNADDLKVGTRGKAREAKPKPRDWTVAEFVGEFVTHEWRTRAEIEQLAVGRGLKRTNAERLLKIAEADRLVIRDPRDGRSPPVFGRADLKPQPPQTGGAF